MPAAETETMVERVAKALCRSYTREGEDPDLFWAGNEDNHRRSARFAIEASGVAELVAALNLLVSEIERLTVWDFPQHPINVARAAIAKATSPAEQSSK